ncbi:MAG: tetratricopeptide repeat protein [Bacteroidetes bacterium]|nr:tetratricopeptide repeat protein [Bacteroidota bacterium]
MKSLFLSLALFAVGITFGQSLEEAKRLTLNEQYEAASSMYKSLVAKFPVKGDYWYAFGENCLKAEEVDSAEALFKLGIKNDPENPINYVGLGKALKTKKNIEEAKSNFAKALEMGKGKNVSVLISVAEAQISIEPKNLSEALTLLQEAEKKEPRNPEIQILQGDAFLENNDGSSAIKYYEKAQELDPKSPQAALRLGQLWVRARNYQGKDGSKGALEYYNEAIAIDPSFAPAYRELGELYAKAQRYQEAKQNYAKYLELSKGNTGARVRYASFLFVTKEYQDALNEIKSIWQTDTTRNLLNRLAAYSAYELKDYESGLNYIQKFFERQPEDKILGSDYAYWGRLLSESGNDSLGIEKLNSALVKDSTDVDLISELAAMYAKRKELDKAIEMYNKKIELGKGTTNDYYRLGQAYYQTQQFGMADTAFMKVTEIQPKLIQGFLWRARANASLDPDSKEGLAKPFYEEVVVRGEEDTTKYQRELLESYKYLGFYYYITKDYSNSKLYWEKVQGIEPKDQQAMDALKDLKTKM